MFTITYAIPNLFLTHVATNLHGVCSPGDEILLVVTYITGTSICGRLMQEKIEGFPSFLVVSVVHGVLNVVDKLSLPLRR